MGEFGQYDRYVWYLVNKIKSWGYRPTREDIADLFQEAHLSLWQTETLDEENKLKYIRLAVFREFNHIIYKHRKVNFFGTSYKEPFVDHKTPLDELIEKEQFERNISLLKNGLTQKELEYIVGIADKHTIVSLNIPDSEFADIKTKLAYLRIFTDTMLSPDENKIAKIYTEVLLGLKNRFPHNFRDKHALFLVRYLFDRILEQDPTKVNQPYQKILKEHKLGELHGDTTKILRKAYPEKLPWEFKRARLTDEILFSAIDYVVEQEGLSLRDLNDSILSSRYERIGFVVHKRFGGLSNLLKFKLQKEECVFARIYKKWMGHESNEYARIAIDFLVEKLSEDYGLKLGDIPQFFRKLGTKGRKIFEHYGLVTMLGYKFHWSIYDVFDFRYPREFHPWEFSSWQLFKDLKERETKEGRAADATRWFMDYVLFIKNPREAINYKKSYLIKKMRESGIGSVANHFDESLYQIFNNAYPCLFKPADFMYGKKGR